MYEYQPQLFNRGTNLSQIQCASMRIYMKNTYKIKQYIVKYFTILKS